jgi:hypothetical protein
VQNYFNLSRLDNPTFDVSGENRGLVDPTKVEA